ncbi:hypothetical protein C7A12_04120 [Pseudomonas fluorescens]|nr:hypothetical protein C1X25_18000 [Pseudomonas sp. GW247-3R2A]PRW80376.1 hypothetical protein C7A12_04120 [Pseudomonas fluorescens]PRW81612.1 hypothetical protein C7A13_05245 [Pseudomonas fluorescens]RZI24799.1 hypothetical protein EUX58_11495 [Pseudomonas sp. 770NI]
MRRLDCLHAPLEKGGGNSLQSHRKKLQNNTYLMAYTKKMWESGLPAMQTPRFFRYTGVMLSQASQLPHKPAPI